jgi:hypothetical protein
MKGAHEAGGERVLLLHEFKHACFFDQLVVDAKPLSRMDHYLKELDVFKTWLLRFLQDPIS